MKKLCTGLLIGLLLSSCTNDGISDLGENEGRIKLSLLTSDKTAQVDLSQFTLILEGPTQKTITCPSDGIVDGLTPGDYSITLTNYLEDEYTPQFADPRYSGMTQTTIKGGQNSAVEVKLKQANAGIFFEYDASLSQTGYGELIPTVKQTVSETDYSLVFADENKDAKGYFAPGTATVTVEHNGELIEINGAYEKQIELRAGQLWRIGLRPDGIEGGITLQITIETVDSPTDEQEWILTPPTDSSGSLEYYGQVWNGPEAFAVITLKNNEKETLQTIIETYLYADNSSFRLMEGRYEISPSLFNYELGSDNTVTHLYEKLNEEGTAITTIEIKAGYLIITEVEAGFNVDVYLDGIDQQSRSRVDNYHVSFECEVAIENRAASFTYRDIETMEAIYIDRGDGMADFINDFKYYVENSEEGYETMLFRLNMLMPSSSEPHKMPMEGTYLLSDSPSQPHIIPGNTDRNNPMGSFISAVMGTVFYDYRPVDGGSVIIERNGKVHSSGAIGYDTKVIVTGAEPGTDIRVTEAFRSSSYIFIEDKTTGDDEQYTIEFTEAVCTYEWSMEILGFVGVVLELKSSEIDREDLMTIELYMPWNGVVEELVTGTYVASDDLDPYTYYRGKLDYSGKPENTYLLSSNNGSRVVWGPLSEGPVQISRTGDTYTIKAELSGINTCTNGAKMNVDALYEGAVTFVDFP